MVVCEDVIDAVVKCEMVNKTSWQLINVLQNKQTKTLLTSKHIRIIMNKLCDDVRNSLLLCES